MASEQIAQPQMAKLYFTSDGKEPDKLWEECKKAQEDWEKWSKDNEVEDVQLQDTIKTLVINFVFMSNKLEGTLPQGADEGKVKQLLSKVYGSCFTTDSDLDSASAGIDII